MTLMPVVRISISVDCSTNSGAERWIGSVWVASTGPRSSTGSPMTLMMRPNVAWPTGIVIGAPVSDTSWPRVIPSVESMAMVRTSFSPRCCATSNTSDLPAFCVRRADRMVGRSESKWTSTTAPITCVTVPTLFLLMRTSLFSRFSHRFRAGDDFDQFLGDLRLTGAIDLDRVAIDHLARVARGAVHGGHLRTLEAGVAFQKRTVDLHRQVARQQQRQQFVLVGLEIIDGAAGIGGLAAGVDREGNELAAGDFLRHRRLEAVVDDGADVVGAFLE